MGYFVSKYGIICVRREKLGLFNAVRLRAEKPAISSIGQSQIQVVNALNRNFGKESTRYHGNRIKI